MNEIDSRVEKNSRLVGINETAKFIHMNEIDSRNEICERNRDLK